jgi:tetratricopeptide (TPR) repeat protein
MSEITLQEYCEDIDKLIEQGSLDAAISHCQHILRTYPKYLPAYRLMGTAALEKDEREAAIDLFGRALSMNPEDLDARIGLSVVNEQNADVEQAVWHMERAFELAPDNQTIIGELRRLYRQRDGVEPTQVSLTRGALARLYARGDLYTQAIHEFRRLLEGAPDRVDLQTALAETLWRAEQRIDAVETSLLILEKLPYCLKANLILGEIWCSSGREEEGDTHLKRAQAIDPPNQTAWTLFGERSPLPPSEVRISRLEYVTPTVPVEESDWLEHIVQEGAGLSTDDQVVPAWLQTVADSADIETSAPTETATLEPDQVPDWLQAAAASAETVTEEIATEPVTTAHPHTESDMPDWLADMAPFDAAPTTAQEPAAIPGDDVPDWLADMAPAAAPADAQEPDAIPGDDVPDWLAAMAPAAAPADAQEPDAVPGVLPDWLSEMAPAESAPPVAEQAGLAPADIPDWLSAMAPPAATRPGIPDLDLPPADVPDWLIETASPEAESQAQEPIAPAAPEPPPLVAAEKPDWLAELVEAAGVSMEEPITNQPAEPEEQALPEWSSEQQEEQIPAAPATIGEPEEEPLAPLGGETEADLMARLNEMSPEDAFAAWEAMLAASESQETAPVPEPAPIEPVAIGEPEQEAPVYPQGETEADLMARLDEMSPEDAFAAWEAMLAASEPQPEAAPVSEPAPSGQIAIEEPEQEAPVHPKGETEADLMARMDEMSPEEAFAAWEATLAASEPQPEAAPVPEPAPGGQIVIEEPEKETLVYPEGAGGEVTATEAELMARMEEMSPEEAFATWEATLAASEPQPEAAPVPKPAPSGQIVIEEPEKETLVYPKGAGGEVTATEAELMARLDEMSPEEAFAAWEAMLAESESQPGAAPIPEPAPSEPAAVEEPGQEALVSKGEMDADLMARLEQMSPEEAFAAWEAMLAEDEPQPEAAPEAVAEPEHTWVSLTEDEELEPVAELDETWMGLAEEVPLDVVPAVEEPSPPEPVAELDETWMGLAEEVPTDIAPPVEEALPLEPVVELDEAWMGLAEEIPPTVAPPVEEAPPLEPAVELDEAWMGLAEEIPASVAPAVEPFAELDETWMGLAEEVPLDVAPAVEPAELDETWVDWAEEQAPIPPGAVAEAIPEPETPSFPAWAVAEAAEMILETSPGIRADVAVGPDWVLLTEEEEASVRTFVEPEPPTRPAEVAVEEKPAAEPVVKVAPPKPRAEIERDDDHQARLERARWLWAAGQREEARAEYERLIRSPLLDDVIADLEKITRDGPPEEPTLRLLGDAYMRDNRLQDALATYRHALDSL